MYIVVQLLHLWPRWQLLNDVQTFSAAWMCRLSAWSQLCRLQFRLHRGPWSPGVSWTLSVWVRTGDWFCWDWGVSSIKSCHPRSLHEDVGGRFCLSLLDCHGLSPTWTGEYIAVQKIVSRCFQSLNQGSYIMISYDFEICFSQLQNDLLNPKELTALCETAAAWHPCNGFADRFFFWYRWPQNPPKDKHGPTVFPCPSFRWSRSGFDPVLFAARLGTRIHKQYKHIQKLGNLPDIFCLLSW